MQVLEAKNIFYTYKNKQLSVDALKDFSYQFEQGKLYALFGASGSGKSTLLNLLGGLDNPTKGEVLFQGKPLRQMDKTQYRREQASFVYQNFNLFPALTCLENVQYVLWLQGVPKDQAILKAKAALNSVHLDTSYYGRLPRQISGGEQQRVALARSLVSGAELILADEPTGNLDQANSEVVLELLRSLVDREKVTVIVASHDQNVKNYADEIIEL